LRLAEYRISLFLNMHNNSKAWFIVGIMAVAIKIVAAFPPVVERYYSNGLYQYISAVQRLLLGWAPFSLGDCLYAAAILYLLVKLMKFIKIIFKREASRRFWLNGLKWLLFHGLAVYVLFNILWGLNYNRLGIGNQLNLEMKEYTSNDLATVMQVIIQRLHQNDSVGRKERSLYANPDSLFEKAIEAYRLSPGQLNWLRYSNPSLKPSLFGTLGNYLGYTGYYNPFSGEAQVNTKVPLFVQPFTTCHEIGHQLGYAKENEANFAGYLSAKSSDKAAVRYSLYFDLYNYGIRELFNRDSVKAKGLHAQLSKTVKEDFAELKRFNIRYQNPIEPYIRKIYGRYLMANEQPAGMQSYNEVMAFLIGYYKKYGAFAL
jgi:Protein of unknown function (DUF3810)